MKARTRLLPMGTRDLAKLFDPRLDRRAFIPTRIATPPFASLDQHPASGIRVTIGRWVITWRRGGAVYGAARGFYGNGGSVARDNVVIGIGRGGIPSVREREKTFSCISERKTRRGSSGWKRQRLRNKRSPAGLPPTVPREITRRTPPVSTAYS